MEPMNDQITAHPPPDADLLPCYLVNNLTKNTEEQCKFVIDNECLDEEGTIDYVYLVYCRIGYDLHYAAIGLIVFLVIVLFLNLSSVADEYLCPSLLSVAKNLRMSDSLAGVTLLAFGNGCPDIFASLAAASSGRPKLIVGELLGAGIFCTSIVAGLVFISTEFKPDCRPLLRDGIFYSLSVCLVWYFCWQRSITFYGALAFIIIYVIYLMFALCDQFIQSRLSRRYLIAEAVANKEKIGSGDTLAVQDENSFIWRRGSQEIVAEVKKQQANQQQRQQQKIKTPPLNFNGGEVSLEIQMEQAEERANCSTCKGCIDDKGRVVARLKTYLNEEDQSKMNQPSNVNLTENHHLKSQRQPRPESNGFTLEEWDNFLVHLNPIDCDSWRDSGLAGKLVQVLRAPLLFATILTVPVVDREKANNNWCRLLNSIHCFMIPFIIMLITDFGGEQAPAASGGLAQEIRQGADHSGASLDYEVGDERSEASSCWHLPLSKCVMLALGLALGVFVFKVTEAFKAPKYHAVFAYFGFAMSIMWIYLLANEIISLLKTVGIMFSMTDTAIGLGVLAWGNSLGDIVANLSLAESGYPRMALGASIGAPLLNLLLGFGLSFTVSLKPGQETSMEYSRTVTLLCSTLIIILISIMLSTLIPSNRSRKPFGYVLIGGYVVYFLLAVCMEYGILFGPQTQHQHQHQRS